VVKVKTNDQASEEIIKRIKDGDPVTAACTVNDGMAADIMTKLMARGISIPDQICITGFDDTEFSKKNASPAHHHPHRSQTHGP
jgi:DNA-binding LacI/PurR family transcriptional regulator